MASQDLTIRVILRNLAKSGLLGLDKSLGGLSKSAKGVEKGLGGSLLKANLLSSAITSGIGAGLSAVQNLVGGVSSAIGTAANSQQELLAATASFSAVAGRSFQESSRFISEFETNLAKSVASLPGATSGYIQLSRSIADELIPAFTNLRGELDEQGLSRTLGNISANAGLLGSAAGLQGSDSALAIQRAIGGASTAELRQLAFFERNPALLRKLEESLAEVGAKSFKELDPASVVKIVENSLAQFATPELKRESAKSFNGLIEGLRSQLFDPQVGVFGFLRDLDPALAGSQTLLDRFTQTTRLLIGSGGVLDSIGSAGSRLLGGRDPLVIVDNALAGFNEFLEGFQLSDMRETLGTFFTEGLPDLINQGVDGALAAIREFDWAAAGKAWADVVGDLWSGTITFIRNIDWVDAWRTIELGISGFRDFMLNYFKETTRKMLDAAGRAARELIFPTGFEAANPDDFIAGSPVARAAATPRGFAKGGYLGAMNPVLGSVVREIIQSPRGAQPLLANSTEMILTAPQAERLAGAAAGRGPIGITVNPVFNINGATNPEQVAREVLAILDRMVSDRIAGSLA